MVLAKDNIIVEGLLVKVEQILVVKSNQRLAETYVFLEERLYLRLVLSCPVSIKTQFGLWGRIKHTIQRLELE